MRLAGLIAFGLLAPMLASAQAYPLHELDPLAKASFYSTRVLKFLATWPPPTASLPDSRPVLVRAIRTPSHPSIVGMVKHFTVNAPLDRVLDVSERVEEYPNIWEDVISVKVVSRDRNRTVTEWVRKAPAFFLPKIHYRMTSVSERSADRVVFRHQLIDGNALKTSDSVVVYERVSPTRTRISVVNFFDANFGPFRSIIEGKIWKTSLQNAFKDDIAFSAHLDHPDWNAEQLTDEAEHELARHPIDHVEYTDLLQLN